MEQTIDAKDEAAGHAAEASEPNAAAWASVAAALALAACGGGGGGSGAPAGPGGFQPGTAALIPADAPEAARFLAQAGLGSPREEIAAVQELGYDGWMAAQFATPPTQSHMAWLAAQGYDAEANRNSLAGLDSTIWRKLVGSPDPLRQRVVLALSEILVVSVLGVSTSFRQFAIANYLDILETHAFGNWRDLMRAVTLSTAMGYYLTYRGNRKASTSGSQPDENYARELMQLFSIGLVQLNADGTVQSGAPETYRQEDVSGLARVFTGWDLDTAGLPTPVPASVHGRPMAQVATRYETGAKTFLGTTIAAGVPASDALDRALDTLFQHPNLPPFISRQLIQRLVTSNPDPAYVGRVAAIFRDNGFGVRGDMKTVLRAILLDDAARAAPGLQDPTFGKLREPVLRFLHWARTFRANSPAGTWGIGDLSDPGSRLGQSPMRSPSVFNFFRPGYVPPNTALAQSGLAAPEFQIATESTVAGYLNYMQNAIAGSGIGDVRADYTALLAIATDATALLAEVNLLLAASQLSEATLASLRAAVGQMPSGTDAARRNRVLAAVLLVLAAPEFLVQK